MTSFSFRFLPVALGGCVLITACTDRALVEPEGGFTDNRGGPTGPIPDCYDAVLPFPDASGRATIDGDSREGTREHEPPCRSGAAMSGPESWVLFEAPRQGTYTFSTRGSTGDTVLEVLDGGACAGASLGCSDDVGDDDLTSEVSVFLARGQRVTVVVDSYNQQGAAPWTLGVAMVVAPSTPMTCEPDETDVRAAPIRLEAELAGRSSDTQGPCGGSGPEYALQWTPPVAGRYSFDVILPGFDSVIYLQQGAECSGATLACNDDLPDVPGSGFVADLGAGVPVTIVVDSNPEPGVDDRDFLLEVRPVPGSCRGDARELFEDAFDTTAEGLNSGGLSCGGTSAPDRTFVYTAPTSGEYRFELDADFNWVLGIWDATCSAELACVNARSEDEELVMFLGAGQQVVVQVDGMGRARGEFELFVEGDGSDPVFPCPASSLPSDDEFFVEGGLFDESGDRIVLPCNEEANAIEATFEFVAPFPGAFVFDTFGSDFDTVLGIVDGSCNGPVLACNDDVGGSFQSSVVVDLFAGQAIILVVEGYGGGTGIYQLHGLGT